MIFIDIVIWWLLSQLSAPTWVWIMFIIGAVSIPVVKTLEK